MAIACDCSFGVAASRMSWRRPCQYSLLTPAWQERSEVQVPGRRWVMLSICLRLRQSVQLLGAAWSEHRRH